MIFGFNTDVKYGDSVYHVQSEARVHDRLLQTQVFVKGRCIGKRATSYADQVELPGFSDEHMQALLREQHRVFVNAARAGSIEAELNNPRPMAFPDLAAAAQANATPTAVIPALTTAAEEAPSPPRGIPVIAGADNIPFLPLDSGEMTSPFAHIPLPEAEPQAAPAEGNSSEDEIPPADVTEPAPPVPDVVAGVTAAAAVGDETADITELVRDEEAAAVVESSSADEVAAAGAPALSEPPAVEEMEIVAEGASADELVIAEEPAAVSDVAVIDTTEAVAEPVAANEVAANEPVPAVADAAAEVQLAAIVVEAAGRPVGSGLQIECTSAGSGYDGATVVLKVLVAEEGTPVPEAQLTCRASVGQHPPRHVYTVTQADGSGEIHLQVAEADLSSSTLLIQATHRNRNVSRRFKLAKG